jgi:hypothetical protein
MKKEMLEWLNQSGEKKTTAAIEQWSEQVEASSLYHHPEKREFFREAATKLGLDPARTTTFDWLEADDNASYARKAA